MTDACNYSQHTIICGTGCYEIVCTITTQKDGAVNTLALQVSAVLCSIAIKNSAFDVSFLATDLSKSDIKHFDTQTKTLATCFIAKTLAFYSTTANALIAQINNSFASVRTAYGI